MRRFAGLALDARLWARRAGEVAQGVQRGQDVAAQGSHRWATAGLSTSASARGGSGGPLEAYEALVRKGEVTEDPHQREAVQLLQSVYSSAGSAGTPLKKGAGFFSQWFGGGGGGGGGGKRTGLYLWGGPGCGKTFLMDLLYASRPEGAPWRRVHFHEFMLGVHQELHVMRQADPGGGGGTGPLAQRLAAETKLLCLDEFQVTDVADAMLLRRLFAHLSDHGMVMVATSNRPPEDLYKNGLNRDLFLPFIAQVRNECVVHHLDSGVDYRRLGTPDDDRVYHTPLGQAADQALEAAFERLSVMGGSSSIKAPIGPATVPVAQGRSLTVPRARGGVARATFHELCAANLGASDYMALARSFHTLVLDQVPVMGINQRNEARRFITLVDVLYEHQGRLVLSAEAPASDLFVWDKDALALGTQTKAGSTSVNAKGGSSGRSITMVDGNVEWSGTGLKEASLAGKYASEDVVFASERLTSRLDEMQSAEYLETHRQRFLTGPRGGESSGSHPEQQVG